MFDNVKDSGVREEFNTGSRRDTQAGKGRFDLLPFIALRRLAVHYENGSSKYGDHNWRKGQPLSRYFSSAMRHMFRWMMGWKDEDHLSAAIWNLCSLLETEEMIKRGKLPTELDDRHEQLLDDYDYENPPVWVEPMSNQKDTTMTIEHVFDNGDHVSYDYTGTGLFIRKNETHIVASGEYTGILSNYSEPITYTNKETDR